MFRSLIITQTWVHSVDSRRSGEKNGRREEGRWRNGETERERAGALRITKEYRKIRLILNIF